MSDAQPIASGPSHLLWRYTVCLSFSLPGRRLCEIEAQGASLTKLHQLPVSHDANPVPNTFGIVLHFLAEMLVNSCFPQLNCVDGGLFHHIFLLTPQASDPMTLSLKKSCFLAVTLVLSLVNSASEAAIIDVGDLIVSDFTSGVLFKIDPVSGVQTVIASGGGLVNPHGIAIESAGTILVAERSSQSLLRLDLVTGIQTTVSSGGNFVNIIDVELEANGDILVSDAGANAIFRVDPVTGVQSTVSSGSFVNNLLRGMAVESNGNILALNNNVLRIDPVGGGQTLLASGSNFQASANIVVEASGTILVVDRSAFSLLGGIIRVDPLSGAQSVVSSGGNFVDPFGLALEANGQILVGDFTTNSVYRVDPISGVQTLLSTGGFLADPLDMEISQVTVAVPEPSALTLTIALLGIGLCWRKRA